MDLGRIHTPKSTSQILKICTQLHYHGNKRVSLEFVAKFVAKGGCWHFWERAWGSVGNSFVSQIWESKECPAPSDPAEISRLGPLLWETATPNPRNQIYWPTLPILLYLTWASLEFSRQEFPAGAHCDSPSQTSHPHQHSRGARGDLMEPEGINTKRFAQTQPGRFSMDKIDG